MSINLESFTPLKLIGTGAYGEVFLAMCNTTKNLYAIKSLKKESLIKRNKVNYLITELNIYKKLSKKPCPYIVSLRYAFQNDNYIFMIFDFLQGGEIFYHMNTKGTLSEDSIRFYASEICVAIGYLHDMGVIYRDLKLENLCLDTKGHVYLIDLGLCTDEVFSYSSGSKSYCGTAEYLAPEILKSLEHGLAVDWWAFGILLYEMFVGEHPWSSNGDDEEEIADKILNKDLVFPMYLKGTLRDLITKLLNHDPKQRLGSKGTKEVMDHPFFDGINFHKIANMEVEPLFVPSGSNLYENFDPEFTNGEISCLFDKSSKKYVKEFEDFKDFNFNSNQKN